MGAIEWEKGFPSYYRQCWVCGYAVRHFLPMNPYFLEAFQECRSPSEAPDLSRLGARPLQVAGKGRIFVLSVLKTTTPRLVSMRGKPMDLLHRLAKALKVKAGELSK